ncbi:hypothetical protein AAGV33_15625 [Flavobacterium sp. FBOR7N2.3]|uniref:DUF748 domain-containing protein n=1 Tax=Flavobacterium magnesitis TaxID=3138077 RepID=A0ABV4TSF4_9FLAO
MKIRNKKYIKIFSILLFIVLGILILQGYAKKKLEGLIVEKIPQNYSLKYSDIDINIVLGNIALNNTSLKIKNKDTTQYHTDLKTESLELNGIGYWDLLFNEILTIKSLELKNPKLLYYPYKKSVSKETDVKSNDDGIKTLNIKKIAITNGSVAVMRKSADSIKMALSSYNLTILDSSLDLKSKEKMPVTYNSYELDAQEIVLDNNAFDKLKIDSVSANKEELKITNFQIIPKYGKKELSAHLKKERDYIKLNIPQIILKEFDFNLDKPRLAITATSGEIVKPNLEIYRDKLIADDLTIKPLYSKSLRNLSFDLKIDELKIKNGYISYAELVDPDKKAGKLFFDEVDATIYEISNLKKAKKTEIKVISKLMGEAPLTLNWTFDVNNSADEFTVNGSVSNLNAPVLNPFFQPNLNALAEGTLQQMYFNFYANNTVSKGEMKMKYDDFNFKILRKNSNKINKVLTTIGNIFIRKDSKEDPKDFRYGDIEAERDATKSFFNYLWINVKSGVVSTLTGNGKKE